MYLLLILFVLLSSEIPNANDVLDCVHDAVVKADGLPDLLDAPQNQAIDIRLHLTFGWDPPSYLVRVVDNGDKTTGELTLIGQKI
jgi:hypothetical protein